MIPGVEYLNLAISSLTFPPGSCPPSPGFAPCAIFIWSTSALTKYSGVTPNLPEAICFIFERLFVPYLSFASPPSPEFDLPPIEFIASARVSWAFGDNEPKLIPAESNLFRICFCGSTFDFLIFGFLLLNSKRSLSMETGLEFTKLEYFLYSSSSPLLTASCNVFTTSGL